MTMRGKSWWRTGFELELEQAGFDRAGGIISAQSKVENWWI